MDVSSATNSATAGIDAMKKANEVQEQSVMKLLESAQEQTKNMNTSQKTGMGNTIDLMS